MSGETDRTPAIRAVRSVIAHDYDGTDEEILWQAIAVRLPAIVLAIVPR